MKNNLPQLMSQFLSGPDATDAATPKTPKSTTESLRIIRLLFLAIIPILSVQYLFCEAVEEIYPAITLPSFKKAPTEFDASVFKLVLHFQDRSQQVFTQHEFFPDAPISIRNNILKQLHESETQFSYIELAELKTWLQRRSNALTQSKGLAYVEVQKIALHRDLYSPSQDVEEVVINSTKIHINNFNL